MHFLLQLLRNLVETKRTGTFQQNKFVAQTLEDIAGQEVLHIGKEALFIDMYSISLCRKFRTYSNKLLHTTFHTEVADLCIKCLWRRT